MNSMRTLLGKEVKSYFASPIAYIVISVFLIMSGWFFTSSLFLIGQSSMDSFLSIAPLLLTFFVPAITMKLFAEELKLGTFEVLTTLPIKDSEIVLAKYLSALFVIAAAIGLTLIYPVTLIIIGKIDIGEIFCTYIGMLLTGAAFASIGLFTSSITRNQIIAFILSFVICFAMFLLGKSIMLLPPGLIELVEYISIDSHINNISKGVIDSRDIVYFGSIIGFFYFLTLSWVSSRRWK